MKMICFWSTHVHILLIKNKKIIIIIFHELRNDLIHVQHDT